MIPKGAEISKKFIDVFTSDIYKGCISENVAISSSKFSLPGMAWEMTADDKLVPVHVRLILEVLKSSLSFPFIVNKLSPKDKL